VGSAASNSWKRRARRGQRSVRWENN
jgi:hypothetical protein